MRFLSFTFLIFCLALQTDMFHFFAKIQIFFVILLCDAYKLSGKKVAVSKKITVLIPFYLCVAKKISLK